MIALIHFWTLLQGIDSEGDSSPLRKQSPAVIESNKQLQECLVDD